MSITAVSVAIAAAMSLAAFRALLAGKSFIGRGAFALSLGALFAALGGLTDKPRLLAVGLRLGLRLRLRGGLGLGSGLGLRRRDGNLGLFHRLRRRSRRLDRR